MKPVFLRAIVIPVCPLGGSVSVPLGIGTAVSGYPVKPVRPLEHPQELTSSGAVVVQPSEPTNSSILVQ